MTYRIEIIPLDGSNFYLEVNNRQSIKDIKVLIEKQMGWLSYTQTLLSYESGPLENNKLIPKGENVFYLKIQELTIIDSNKLLKQLSRKWQWEPDRIPEIIEKYGNISDWMFSPEVNNMSYLFSSSSAIKIKESNNKVKYVIGGFNLDISKWNTKYITNMSHMFCGNKDFNQDISKWNVKNVKNMTRMFNGNIKLKCDLSQWDVSSLEKADSAFEGLDLAGQDFSKWNPERLESCNKMFKNCKNLDMDLSKWILPIVSHTTYMFEYTDLEKARHPRKLDKRGRTIQLDK